MFPRIVPNNSKFITARYYQKKNYKTLAVVVNLLCPILFSLPSSFWPDVHPGNCWAFKGSRGYLVIRLAEKIYPTAFTVEHIPKTLSPTGTIASAPRDFSVYGLDDESQAEGKLLGQYVYDQDGEPLQMFPVLEKNEKAFQIVELRTLLDWGDAAYTCLYRFRVHGEPA
ncbi:SUN domain-containing protein 1-like [Pterocles gutturalis]